MREWAMKRRKVQQGDWVTELYRLIITSLAAALQLSVYIFRRKLERQHDEQWKKSDPYTSFTEINLALTTKTSQNCWKISWQASHLTQLQTGHIPRAYSRRNSETVSSSAQHIELLGIACTVR